MILLNMTDVYLVQEFHRPIDRPEFLPIGVADSNKGQSVLV